jgi:hypothetical protein
MTKNTIFNSIIGFFLLSSGYNLSACIFNSTGITNGEPSIVTTEMKDDSTSGNITKCDEPIVTISYSITDSETETTAVSTTPITTNLTTTLTTVDSATLVTTTENNITESSTTDECGDCILQEFEECDWCLFDQCKKEDERYLKKCNIDRNINVQLYLGTPLIDMSTSAYDKEEADLLCKIILGTANAEAGEFYSAYEGFPSYDVIAPIFVAKEGLLMKSIQFSKQSFYYYKWEYFPDQFKQEEMFALVYECLEI